jgi:hypothetical protein
MGATRRIATMKPTPRLRLEPRPSRLAAIFIAATSSATAALMVAQPLPPWLAIAAVMAIVALAIAGWRRCSGHGVPALLHVGIDRRVTVTDRKGRSCNGAILDDSYVGARLTTIVWRPDGVSAWRPAKSLLMLPDMLAADDFRRLRVLLRYGRTAIEAGSKERDAG